MVYKNNLTGIHLYCDHLEFPVVLYEKSQWDKTQMEYLDTSIHTTESLINWANAHKIGFDVIPPLKITTPIRHPLKFLHYIQLKHKYKFT